MNRTTEYLTTIRRIIRQHDNLLKPVSERYGLTAAEMTVISFLHNNPGKDTAADIVELRMLSKGNVSKAVESLIQKSLLRREPDGEDRRKIHLSLLPAAGPITAEIETARETFREKLFQRFSPEERELFDAFNRRLMENIQSIGERGDLQ
jgi:DNA-binding MarR family transcriptional regulator